MMEEEATCSLCMEVFTDPVSLPCGHGFCRGCLKSVVDHKTKTGEDTSSDSAILTCPLCRAEVTLGSSGVDELQPNHDLSDLIQRRAEVKDSAATTPLCDMCENDNRKADRYCTNCMALYCERCLEAKHPRRGPFGRHRLMSMEQYLSEQTSHDADLKTTLGEADCNVANCKEHKQPLSLYCGTCERPICNGCFSAHDQHIMQHVSATYARNKAPLENQIGCCRSLKSEFEKLQSELVATQTDIQTKTDEEYKQIDVNYDSGLKSLQDWRESERRKVDEKRDTLTSESLSLLKSIHLLMEETERLLRSSSDLLSGNEALFLLESKELLVRLQCHSTDSNGELEEKRRKITELRSALSRCNFRPCVFTIQHATQECLRKTSYPHYSTNNDSPDTTTDNLPGSQQINPDGNSQRERVDRGGPQGTGATTPTNDPSHSCAITQTTEGILTPLLKFTESTKADVTIEEDSRVVQDKPGNPACGTTVRTDGLITGTQYWEVEVSWRLSSSAHLLPCYWWAVCAAGVRQEASDFGSSPGNDHLSCGVWIRYQRSTNSYRFECRHQRKEEFISTQHILRDKTASHRLGFLYQPSERTLTVVDKLTDTRLHTFRGLDVSRPFVPVVTFGLDNFLRTIRLLPVDQSSPLGYFLIS